MSFETWWETVGQHTPMGNTTEQIWDASRAEAEAEMRAPGPCGKRGHLMANLDMRNEQGVCAWCEEIAVLKAERDKLREVLQIPSQVSGPYFDSDDMPAIAPPNSGQANVLKTHTVAQTAEHFKKVTRPVDWPTDEPDTD